MTNEQYRQEILESIDKCKLGESTGQIAGAVVGAIIGICAVVFAPATGGASLTWWAVAMGMFAGASVGSAIGGLIDPPKPATLNFGNSFGSPRYGFGALVNTFTNEIPVPILYGELKLSGNVLYNSAPGLTIYRAVGLCEGEIEGITNVRVNDVAIGDLTGCSVSTYTGTTDQTVDARFSPPAVYGLRNLAYYAMTLQTSDDLQGGNPTTTCDVQGTKVSTWDGDSWSVGKTYSRNPVACLRDLLTNDRYGANLPLASIDSTTWGAAHEYCDGLVANIAGDGTETRAILDYIIDGRKPILDVLNDILGTFGGFLIFSGNSIKLRIESSEAVSQAFTMANIIRGSFVYRKESKDNLPNRIKVQYIDPNYNYTKIFAQTDDVIDQANRRSLGLGEDIETKEVALLGITRYSQAARMSRLFLYLAKTCGTYCSFQVGPGALSAEVGDIISISHDVPSWTAKEFRIISISATKEDKLLIICREYNSSIYDGYQSALIVPKYNSTTNPYTAIADVTNLAGSEVVYYDKDGHAVSDISVTWTATTDIDVLKHYVVQVKKGAAGYYTYSIMPRGATACVIKHQENDAIDYYIKVKTVSIGDITSLGATSAKITLNGNDVACSDVASFANTFTDEIVFTWDKVTDSDLLGYEIRTEDANWGTQSAALVWKGNVNTHTIVTPASRTPGKHYIKAYDRSGNFSTTADDTTPTNSAPAAPTVSSTQWFGFAKLEWTDTADTDLLYYEVWKSATNAWGGEEALEARVSGTHATIQGNAPVDAIADSADATTMVDATIAGMGADYFVGDIIVQVDGTHDGQSTTITGYTTGDGTITVASWPSGTPDVGDKFVIKDRAYYKVAGVDTYGTGTLSSAQTVNFTPLAEAELGDEIITGRKVTTGELITLTAQIKDAIINNAKILDVSAEKITVGTLSTRNLHDNGDFKDWSAGASSAPDGWGPSGVGVVIRRNSASYIGDYACDVVAPSGNATQIESSPFPSTEKGADYYQSRQMTVSGWVKCDTANKARIQMNCGPQVFSTDYHTGSGDWEYLKRTQVLASNTSQLYVNCRLESGGDWGVVASGTFDGISLVEGGLALPWLPNARQWGHTADYTEIDGGTIRTGTIIANAVVISGGTNLDDWRKSGDLTKIDGGSISTSTITADKITSGSISTAQIDMTVAGGTGDCFVRAGIAAGDFDNSGDASGFILGIDDSDSDKAKFFFGDDAENIEWNGTNLLVSGQNLVKQTKAEAGDVKEAYSDGEDMGSADVWEKLKEIVLVRGGEYRISFSYMGTAAGSGKDFRVYKNGSGVGTNQSDNSGGYSNHSEDISGWSQGDLCQLYVNSGGNGEAYVKEFQIDVLYPTTSYVSDGTAPNWPADGT